MTWKPASRTAASDTAPMRTRPAPDDRRRLARLRLAAQRLTTGPAPSPADAVRAMLAMQAQDYPGVKWSVALRAGGATEADVEAACDAGEIVRSWPMRGTLHLVAAEDLPWMLQLTAARALTSVEQRRVILGITQADTERARELAVDALPGRRSLTRRALLAAIDAGGVVTSGQRGYHLLWYLAQTGTLVLGPTSGREQTFARLDAWITHPKRLEHDEALGELARRYFTSHGPAVVEDLTRWSGLTVREVRRAIQIAGDCLRTLVLDGREYLTGASTPDADRDAGVLLLPGFDEYILGYRDRSAMLAPEHSAAIVPGNNGMFKATIVVDGEVIGTWGKTAGARWTTVEPAAFEELSARDRDRLAAEVDRFGRYLGVPGRLRTAAGA